MEKEFGFRSSYFKVYAFIQREKNQVCIAISPSRQPYLIYFRIISTWSWNKLNKFIIYEMHIRELKVSEMKILDEISRENSIYRWLLSILVFKYHSNLSTCSSTPTLVQAAITSCLVYCYGFLTNLLILTLDSFNSIL